MTTRNNPLIQRKGHKFCVKVEPIFVPRIMPIVCVKVKLPAETSPTVITMTAELLCRKPVKMIPAINPFQGLSVNFVKTVFNFSPDKLKKSQPQNSHAS